MSINIINRRDLDFQLFEVLKVQSLLERSRFTEHSVETLGSAIDLAHAIAQDQFASHNKLSDANEPQFDGVSVKVIDEVKQAVRTYAEAGLIAASHDESLGGMQLPTVLSQACMSLFKSANIATTSYVGLTQANANVIHLFGTERQKRLYLEPLLAGRFLGTMAITEPHAGSSVGDLSCSARRNPDGTFSIRGNKIFISAGDHDVSENIIHLVLARIEGSQRGSKGISLFIVPKFRVTEDGALGAGNDVALAGLIHKMGWRGTTSTMLSFGENDECRGELIGKEGEGLACMFHMMNEARIGVGIGATMLGYRGYLESLEYARERRQGRKPDVRDPESNQVPIIQHADVKRMLLIQKAYVEGAYALCLYAAWLVDEKNTAEMESDRAEASQLLELLTPVVKSWPSQWCLEANSLAIQIHGGYGFTREYPVEQFYRDNRLNMIHEGTHGIQALDLLGRKLKRGERFQLLRREMQKTMDQARGNNDLSEYVSLLEEAVSELDTTIQSLKSQMADDEVQALANATVFLELFGHVVIAWMWLRQAAAAQRGKGVGEDKSADANFYAGKVQACRFFYRHELPRMSKYHALLRAGESTTMQMHPDWF